MSWVGYRLDGESNEESETAVARDRGTTTVFTDDSGTRAKVFHWATRGACGVLAATGGAVALSLALHVPLPGLGLPELPWSTVPQTALSPSPTAEPTAPAGVELAERRVLDVRETRGGDATRATHAAKATASPAEGNTPAAAVTPAAAPSSPASGSAPAPSSTPAPQSSGGTPNEHAADAATNHPKPASAKSQGKGRRATPTHAPGSPPSDPPGKSKNG